MNSPKRALSRLSFLVTLLASLACAGFSYASDEKLPADTSKPLQEMPVLTGNEWQTMQPASKLAFLLGVGHVVTIEENVIQRHPELKRKGFTAKLAEGLSGVPMDSIIGTVDSYYRNNPDELGLPVMGVIWQQIVKPKLKSGIADQPLTGNNGQ